MQYKDQHNTAYVHVYIDVKKYSARKKLQSGECRGHETSDSHKMIRSPLSEALKSEYWN